MKLQSSVPAPDGTQERSTCPDCLQGRRPRRRRVSCNRVSAESAAFQDPSEQVLRPIAHLKLALLSKSSCRKVRYPSTQLKKLANGVAKAQDNLSVPNRGRALRLLAMLQLRQAGANLVRQSWTPNNFSPLRSLSVLLEGARLRSTHLSCSCRSTSELHSRNKLTSAQTGLFRYYGSCLERSEVINWAATCSGHHRRWVPVPLRQAACHPCLSIAPPWPGTEWHACHSRLAAQGQPRTS